MESSSIASSRSLWQLTCLLTFFIFFIFITFTTSVSCSITTLISYSEHCASIIPEAAPTVIEDTTYHPFMETHMGYYSGGEKLLGRYTSGQTLINGQTGFIFRTIHSGYKTNINGVYKIEAELDFPLSRMNYYQRNSVYNYEQPEVPVSQKLSFHLKGFWSESSEKLCMTGSAPWYTKQGNFLKLDAVLKLNFAKNTTITNSVVSGILESLNSPDDASYFDPFFILAFSKNTPYKYTLVSKEFDRGLSDGLDYSPNSSRSLQQSAICSTLSKESNVYKLQFGSKCNNFQNCTPFIQDIGYMPHFMSLKAFSCHGKKLRYLVQFSDWGFTGSHFHLNSSFVAEASWDERKNRLCVAACPILLKSDPFLNVHLGACSIRLSLRYRGVLSIRDSVRIEGEIWTSKVANEPGYFDRIAFQSIHNSLWDISPGLKYKYTEVHRATCRTRKGTRNKGDTFPIPHEHCYNMTLTQIWVKNSKGDVAFGDGIPISVGNSLYTSPRGQSRYQVPDSLYTGAYNISYQISVSFVHDNKFGDKISPVNSSLIPCDDVNMFRGTISAEGVYDAVTGHLCMVGCRNLDSYAEEATNASMDCEIRVNLQFPPFNGKMGNSVRGSIESTRENDDPLYFEHMTLSSITTYHVTQAQYSIIEMNARNTFTFHDTLKPFLVGFQLLYVIKHPDMLPLISVFMLLILILFGCLHNLLNLFTLLVLFIPNEQFVVVASYALPVGVIGRVITMSSFLLNLRLLKLVWKAKSGNRKEKGWWAFEQKSLLISLLCYMIVGLVVVYQPLPSWWGLVLFLILVRDGFLFPQIILNIIQNLNGSALSYPFYLGITFEFLLYLIPLGDRCCTNFPDEVPSFDQYVNFRYGVRVLLAGILYLQQRFGGLCIVPRIFKGVEGSEKVPLLSS